MTLTSLFHSWTVPSFCGNFLLRTELFFSCSTLVNMYPYSSFSLQTTWSPHMWWTQAGAVYNGAEQHQGLWLCVQVQPGDPSCWKLLPGWVGWLCTQTLCQAQVNSHWQERKARVLTKLRDANILIFCNCAFKLLLGDDHWTWKLLRVVVLPYITRRFISSIGGGPMYILARCGLKAREQKLTTLFLGHPPPTSD